MLEKIRNLGNLPLVIILVIVILIAIVLSIFKSQKSQESNADTYVSDALTEEKVDKDQEQWNQEEEIIVEENIQEIVDETEKEEENVNAKYFIKVNYGQNVVTIYTKDSNGEYTVPYKAMVCSTGTATPRSGTYTIPSGTYSRGTWGMMVGGVWAQYFTRIKGSILFHSVPYTERNKWSLEYWEYDKLGIAASAGCIRLTVEDAKWIYNNCPAGTKVEFYTDSNPGPLGKPTAQKISEEEPVRGWDPTDPDSTNPWKTYTPEQEDTQETEPEESTTTTKPSTSTKPTTNPTKPSTSTKPTTNPTTPTEPEETPEQNPEPEKPNEGQEELPNEGGENLPSEGENSGEENQSPGDETDVPTENPEENTGKEENPTPDEGGNSEEIEDQEQNTTTSSNVVLEI